MKKIIFFLLLLVLIFGCAKVNEVTVDTTKETKTQSTVKVEESTETSIEPSTEAETAKETDTGTEETSAETETEAPEGVDVITAPQPQIETTGELKQLLDKLEEKIKNIKYLYGAPPQIAETNTYWVQVKNSFGEDESLIKIDLFEYEPKKLEDYWDTVFLNLKTKEAEMFCIDRTLCQSQNIDKRDQKETVEFDEYFKKTPFDWAKEIPANAKIIGPELLEGRTVTRFEYTGTDGTIFNIWVDNTYGVPMQVEAAANGEELHYLFRDMTFNSGKDEDFKPPF